MLMSVLFFIFWQFGSLDIFTLIISTVTGRANEELAAELMFQCSRIGVKIETIIGKRQAREIQRGFKLLRVSTRNKISPFQYRLETIKSR